MKKLILITMFLTTQNSLAADFLQEALSVAIESSEVQKDQLVVKLEPEFAQASWHKVAPRVITADINNTVDVDENAVAKEVNLGANVKKSFEE